MVKEFVTDFIKNLIYALGINTFKVNTIYSFAIAIMLTPLAYVTDFIRDFLIPEKQFFYTVILLCVVDAIVGVWKSFKQEKFNPLMMLIGLATKLGVCYLVMQIFQAISSPKEFIEAEQPRTYFILTWKLMIMSYPGLSCFNNFYFITNGRFPPEWWMNKMYSFNKNGNVSDLIGANKEEKNEPVEPTQ